MPAKIAAGRLNGNRRLCNRFFHNDLPYSSCQDRLPNWQVLGGQGACEYRLTVARM